MAARQIPLGTHTLRSIAGPAPPLGTGWREKFLVSAVLIISSHEVLQKS